MHCNIHFSKYHNMEIAQISMSDYWANKMWHAHTHIHIHTHTDTHTQEYYAAIKLDEILQFAAIWIELEDRRGRINCVRRRKINSG